MRRRLDRRGFSGSLNRVESFIFSYDALFEVKLTFSRLRSVSAAQAVIGGIAKLPCCEISFVSRSSSSHYILFFALIFWVTLGISCRFFQISLVSLSAGLDDGRAKLSGVLRKRLFFSFFPFFADRLFPAIFAKYAKFSPHPSSHPHTISDWYFSPFLNLTKFYDFAYFPLYLEIYYFLI